MSAVIMLRKSGMLKIGNEFSDVSRFTKGGARNF